MIHFQGHIFVDADNNSPIMIFDRSKDESSSTRIFDSNFTSFLKKLKSTGILNKKRKEQILIADD